MDRVGRRVANKGLLSLLGRFLRAGVEVDGRLQPTHKGVPQGSLGLWSSFRPTEKIGHVGRQSFAGLDAGVELSRQRVAGLWRPWPER